MRNIRNNLEIKYKDYVKQGHLVLTVTLSTFITSEQFAASDRMQHMWDAHFMRRVKRRLPSECREMIDHDWYVERSPDGYYHYHGLIAVKSYLTVYLWHQNQLNPRLHRDLHSFKRMGIHRPFRINSVEIEPVKNIEAWIRYIMKGQFQADRCINSLAA